ncbi:MAG TPA: hypothetical protein VFV73_30575 [Streptosporangiaceae bacterium]|nr:hypothetical protein [Streptosporangiaceae bacterium]
MYGYDHPGDPIGPEPSHRTPDQRAAWHQAFAALGPPAGPDIRAMTDGRLWLLRDTYAAQTAWAPRHVGRELRLSRLGAFDAALAAIRADAEAQAARKTGDHDRAARHKHLAASYLAMRDHYQQQEQALTQAAANRQEWEQATAGARRLAIAADTELRRRHPRQRIEPLRSAEPTRIDDPRLDHLQPASGGMFPETEPGISDLIPRHQATRARIEEPSPLLGPGETLVSHNSDTPSIPAWKTYGQDAILQPPKPKIMPSDRILQLATEHDHEAAD